jgi:hypothetical protein
LPTNLRNFTKRRGGFNINPLSAAQILFRKSRRDESRIPLPLIVLMLVSVVTDTTDYQVWEAVHQISSLYLDAKRVNALCYQPVYELIAVHCRFHERIARTDYAVMGH